MTYLYFSLAIYAALAIAIGLGLWFYFTVHRQIAALRKEVQEIRCGFQPSDRGAVLKMHGEGRAVDAIAAALNLSAADVELTIQLANVR